MEQQLRAGITPTLPTSAHERADLLASSLLPNGNGGGSAASASAGPSGKPSPHVSSFVVPIAPSLTKKRARPRGRDGDGGMVGGNAGAGRGSRARGRRAAGAGAAAGATAAAAAAVAGDSELSFFVVKEWKFAKSKRGAAAIKKPNFFWELWMMMAAFGEEKKLERSGVGAGERGGGGGCGDRQRMTMRSVCRSARFACFGWRVKNIFPVLVLVLLFACKHQMPKIYTIVA